MSSTKARLKTTSQRVLLDQAIGPPCITSVFLFTLNLLETYSPKTAFEITKDTVPKVLLGNYAIWPWIQFANFYYIPVQHRVIVIQVCAFFYNIFVSYMQQEGGSKALLH